MAHARGTLDEPIDRALASVAWAAGAQGWNVREVPGAPTSLHLFKEMTGFSYGSAMEVVLTAQTAARTSIDLRTRERILRVDFGRGRRANRALLASVGADEIRR